MTIHYHRFPELSVKQRNQLVSNYADKAGTFLLDSGRENHEYGRYDIIAVEPVVTINQSDRPFDYLREQLHRFNPDSVPEELRHLPCLGGLFFALSYDLGKYYEDVANQATDDLKLSDFYAAVFDCIIVIDHQQGCSYLICCDDKGLGQYRQLSEQINALLDQENSSEPELSFSLQSDWQANFTETEYRQAFDVVQQHIQAGDCYQVNLAQRFTASCTGSSWRAYCRLTEANNAPFSAFINTGEADILSLSPERFIQLQDRQVETRPIKGTRPRGATAALDQQLQKELQDSKKDQAENLMIVDLMRNDLGRSCVPGSIKVPELFKLETFHSVHHLVSTIKGTLAKNEDAFSLLTHCFPGGSITGTPKIKAMNIIEKLEPHRRSYYCGSIGYIDIRGNMDTSISIRTLVRKDDQIHCWAGGGLVSESRQDEEYQETFDKVSRILPVLENQQN